jgi:hypothetical protein
MAVKGFEDSFEMVSPVKYTFIYSDCPDSSLAAGLGKKS